jgi:hypothetical protein
VRREERRTIAIAGGLLALGVVGALLLPIALYMFGLAVAPPRPVPHTTPTPPAVRDALWARAGGGRADSLRPINHVSIAEMALCVAQAEGANDNERFARCRHVLPAMPGLEYLSALHINDSGGKRNSFLGGHGAFGTTIWMTRSWTKQEFVDTLAARGMFGFGWRGVDAAARGYFDKAADRLSASEAAFLASRLGNHPDPWCAPEVAAALRNRVLSSMHDNGALSAIDLTSAAGEPPRLTAPPAGRPRCGE